MTVNELNPFVRYARTHHTRSRTGVRSIPYDCRLFFAENAAGVLEADEETYKIEPGTVMFLPPGTHYCLRLSAQKDFLLTVLNFDLTQDFAESAQPLHTAEEAAFDPAKLHRTPAPEPLAGVTVRSAPQLRVPLRQCTELFFERGTFYGESASAIVKLCLLEMLRQTEPREGNRALCGEVLRYIRENYALSTLTNQSIAEKFGYHPHYLSSMIRRYTGHSLHRELITYRLRVAKDLLVTTPMDIEEISWRTGFCSASYFIRIFREYTGMTPGQYRKNSLSLVL
jgi:AraC-like DNA-binding protein